MAIPHKRSEIETVARRLCLAEGLDADHWVTFAYGADFTAVEWETVDPEAEVPNRVKGQLWRLYRPKASLELTRHKRRTKIEGNVVAFEKKRKP